MERIASDFTAFKIMCRNDNEKIAVMLSQILTAFADLEGYMEKAIQADDNILIQAHTHKFKSTVGFLGAKSLEVILGAMEFAASGKNSNEVHTLYNSFKTEGLFFRCDLEEEITKNSTTYSGDN